jgi:hypothetical protein
MMMLRAINCRWILFLALWMNNPHLSYSEEIKRDAIEISGLKKTYSVDERVMFIARNISSEKVFVNLRLERNRGGQWVEIIPFIGASHATKSIRVDRFLPNQQKSLAWNGSETGEIYKAKQSQPEPHNSPSVELPLRDERCRPAHRTRVSAESAA